MPTVVDLHSRAMALVDRAERAEGADRAALYRRALKQELEALELLGSLHPGVEPSRAVMHASAASIALKAGDLDRADRLVRAGLQGRVPGDVADELRELDDAIRASRAAAPLP